MNFLEICQEVSRDVGYHGAMSTVASTQPQQRDVARAVRDAWIDIQTSREYVRFMNKVIDFTTTANVNEYDLDTEIVPGGSLADINEIIFQRRNLAVIEENQAPYYDLSTPGQPRVYYLKNDITTDSLSRTLTFNTLDSNTYDLVVSYRKKTQRLPLTAAGNLEFPLCPSDHHYIIQCKAIMNLGIQLQRIDLYDQYRGKYDEQWGYLMRSENPKKRMKNRRFI